MTEIKIVNNNVKYSVKTDIFTVLIINILKTSSSCDLTVCYITVWSYYQM